MSSWEGDKKLAGLRYDKNKVRLDLIPPEWVWGLGEVLTAGAKKYADRNWEKGMKWSRVVGPLLRHLYKWGAGETYDKDTGCHHLAMVAWNALALMSYDLRNIGEKDIPSWGTDILERTKKNAINPDKGLASSGQSTRQDHPRPGGTGSGKVGTGQASAAGRPEGNRSTDVCHCNGGKE